MPIKRKWQRDLERDTNVTPATDFWRVNVWTGPSAVRECAQRVKKLSGMLRCGYVGEGTEKIWFDVQAKDGIDAMQYAAKILTYVGLPSLAHGAGFNARKVA